MEKLQIAEVAAGADKTAKATRFILAAKLFSKPYAKDFEITDITFSTELNKKVAGYIVECKRQGKDIKPSLLYDYVDDTEKEELAEILAEEMVDLTSLNKDRYFKDCVNTLKKARLQFEIETLTKMCEKETDIATRKELTLALMKKMAELNKKP